jgi:hypothetical protein
MDRNKLRTLKRLTNEPLVASKSKNSQFTARVEEKQICRKLDGLKQRNNYTVAINGLTSCPVRKRD